MIDSQLVHQKDFKIAEAMSVYSWLEENKQNKESRLLHFFLFKNFYRIENGGLTDEWKNAFSEKMYEAIDSKTPLDLKAFVETLYQYKNRKGQYSLQFSFATKAVALVNPELPIYDSEVEKAFGWGSLYHIKDFNKRLEAYIDRYNTIINTYQQLSNDLDKEIKIFRKVYSLPNLHKIKILDTLIWRTQKLLK
jgi:uncharacterized protein involved in tolerance to divalent cations